MIPTRLSAALAGSLSLLLVAATSCLCSTSAIAQGEDPSESRRARFAIAAGFDVWDRLSELRPQASGEFDSAGFVIDFSAHWRMNRWGSDHLLIGVDFGVFSNESDVFYVREDLISRGLYLTPSVKWQLESSSGPRYSVDFGLGYYLADIAEVDTSGYNGSYCCYGYSEEELWEDSGFGGYIGTTIDFGNAARRRGGGFTMGAKIHWFDLGTVRDEGPFRPQDTLGTNAGRLHGPVYSMQFGYAF